MIDSDVQPINADALIDRWVEALESGDYIQGESYLRRRGDDGELWCCLGVLCDVAIKAGVEIKVLEPEPGRSAYIYDDWNGSLPMSVCKATGIRTQNASYGDPADGGSLVRDNDSNHKSFAEIAQIIRSRPRGLFNE